MKIKVLSDIVINQIAAGEVVERPASVVRELVDNSVDAGATDIVVALESGGHTRIRVRDNGCGMSRDEALLAFERHATSKVSSITDLTTLTTMGFRGEALASIAAVSKITLTTRSVGEDVGTIVKLRGGKLETAQACAWDGGSEIEVEHLFFNTPARRKFLKSTRAETARIRSWIAHSSLARPSVRYRLISDGDEVLNLSAVDSIRSRALQIFSGDLTPISLREGGVRVEGMIGHPGQALSDGSGFVTLINGRLVSDRIVLKAARDGYDSMLKDREFPIGYLSISMPTEYVDVNVHPQKSEVRFRYPDQIFAVVKGAVFAGVRSIKRPMVAVSSPEVQVGESNARYETGPTASAVAHLDTSVPGETKSISRFDWPIPNRLVAPATKPSMPQPRGENQQPCGENQQPRGENKHPGGASEGTGSVFQPSFFAPSGGMDQESGLRLGSERFYFSELRYIGQLLGCYLVCEWNEKLVVVDMHAAHERINYNKLRQGRSASSLGVQKLLIPEKVRLTSEQVVSLIEQSDLLRALALEIEEIDSETVAVRGVPAILSHLDCVSVIREIAAEQVSIGWRDRIEERIDHITARLACHASVRSGDLINRTEVYALFRELDQAETAGACPHGRPVVAEFSRDSVERWFGRDR